MSRAWRSIATVGLAAVFAACGGSSDNTNPHGGSGGSGGSGRPGGSGGNTTGGTSGGATGGSSGGANGGSGGGGAFGGSGGWAAGGSGGITSAGAGTTNGGSGGSGSGGASGAGGTFACSAPAPTSMAYSVDTSGVSFNLTGAKMKVQVCQADIMRVQYTTAAAIPAKTSLSVNNTWSTPTTFCVTEATDTVTIATARMKAKVNKSTGVISYTDANDNAITAEDSKLLTATAISGDSTYKVQAAFVSPASEGLFGLGQHKDGAVNQKGKKIHFHNRNDNNAGSSTSGGDIMVPLLVSSKGYGVFWDNPADGDFYGDDTNNTKYRFSSNAGDMVDYYFMYGPTIDQVISLYRTATGSVPLLPKWVYGLIHSKDTYRAQDEILAVKDGYRNNKIPLDCLVQDWTYWEPYGWGSHIMDPSRYPDPAKLVSDLHAANLHGMISIWPLYELRNNPPKMTGENDNYNALLSINALYPGNGARAYDTFKVEARTLVFQEIMARLLGKYDWDAIWADDTEPDVISDWTTVTTAIGKGYLYENAYALQHSRGLYENWRKVGPTSKRVFVLTRSGFAGSQRFGSVNWSGDIGSDFVTLAREVPAGLGYVLSGMPYWASDIGGYFGHNLDWSTTQNNELFTRWFQFGAFCSLFRVHGGGARELYGKQWSATTKANLLLIDNLHYRLLPYIYSLAWKVTSENYTFMRPLVFDFQSDAKVYDIKDQFMYGPAFLVNPVTTAGATTRSVYLPAGTWYDFWTGTTKDGGSSSSVSAPLNRIPLFVRAGSIVPMGPMVQYSGESIDPLEIRIYKGANASFTLYEDEGDSYNYETGKSSIIKLTWDDAAQTLMIGARTGSYTGMPSSRTFNIVWVGADHGVGVDVTTTADQSIKYDGKEVTVDAK